MSVWQSRDFKIMVAINLGVLILIIFFLFFIPFNLINFGIVLSAFTSLGAIIGFDILMYRAIKLQMCVDKIDIDKQMRRLNVVLPELMRLISKLKRSKWFELME